LLILKLTAAASLAGAAVRYFGPSLVVPEYPKDQNVPSLREYPLF
jgi:hypothetical protein